METKYTHGRTCVYRLRYHLVWCVKYRRKVLTPEISVRLKEILRKVGEEKGFEVLTCGIGESDHVHCLVAAPPKLSVTDIAKFLKGVSGRRLLEEFPGLREDLWKGRLWNNSYFVEAVGESSEEAVSRYVETQRTRQL